MRQSGAATPTTEGQRVRSRSTAGPAGLRADRVTGRDDTGGARRRPPGDGEPRPGLAGAAGRAAIYPARAAARAWRRPLEQAVDEVLSAPEIARVLDRALAGPLPEEVARSLVRHRVLERMASELAESGELDRLVTASLASAHTRELTDRALASDEFRRALREVASSPEVRAALARQSSGLAEELVGGLRSAARSLDDRLERLVRRRAEARPSAYGGLAARGLAAAVDLALTVVPLMAAVGVASLFAALVGGLRPEWLVGVLLGSGWALVTAGYLVLFWSAAGQTPGMRLLRLRVLGPRGDPPSVGRSLVRVVGLVLSIVPLFAGFVPVPFGERRRSLADLLAGTVVVDDLRGPDQP